MHDVLVFQESGTQFFWKFCFSPTRTVFSFQPIYSFETKNFTKIFFFNLPRWNITCVCFQFFFYKTIFVFLKGFLNIYSKTFFGSRFWTFLFFHPFLLLSHFYTNFNSFFIENAHYNINFFYPSLEFLTSALFNTFSLTGTCWRKRSSRFYQNLFYEVPKIEFSNEKKVTK